MGSITGERLSSHASATCDGVACNRLATRATGPRGFARSPANSGNHGMNAMRSRAQYSSTDSAPRSTRLYRFCTETIGTSVRARSISATDTSESPM